ncbi:hypothetical protein [Liquorilactobacillus nagelii]|uniref:hypothetical protein n=1 Tax=Liquorilactobacillus nagelii TaxID=82688 RepID=UPI0006EF694D|nr:hypothetical protein [Liquorilactobacillus nagelii]KRL40311.1 hypothetical protein FD45_GL002419 [Liquorilactobacillus nagelii DSM 13675]QYH54794.1 hypothetical protein G6O73_09055 [Liquorilactobacillus nagelii DSM 13675]
MKSLDKFKNSFIVVIFTFLIFLTFIGSIRSTNLIIANTSARIFIIPILAFIAWILHKYTNFWFLISHYSLVLAVASFCFVVFFQFYMIFQTHPPIGFDLWAFYNANFLKHFQAESTYFSLYPNNLLLFLIQHKFITLVGTSRYWLRLDLLNVILVDLSALIGILASYLYHKVELTKAIWTYTIWLLFFPMIIVPYSDTFVLPLVSSILLLFVIFIKYTNTKSKFASSLFLGMLTSLTYFMKPSAIIPLIAFAIMNLFNFRKLNKKSLLIIFVFFISLISSYTVINHQLSAQNYIKINKTQHMPIAHFIDIGMSGAKGGYDQQSFNKMSALKNTKQRKAYSIKNIKSTLTTRGPLGYIKFLVAKQGYNTADGTFGWLQEGNFIKASSKRNSNIFKNYLYPDGKYLSDFKFIAQLIWILCLGILLLGFRQQDFLENTLRLGIIGGFIFLLLFEGGRSRYMIQFLPMILIMTIMTFNTSILKIKNIIATITD